MYSISHALSQQFHFSHRSPFRVFTAQFSDPALWEVGVGGGGLPVAKAFVMDLLYPASLYLKNEIELVRVVPDLNLFATFSLDWIVSYAKVTVLFLSKRTIQTV